MRRCARELARARREIDKALNARPFSYSRMVEARSAYTKLIWPNYGEPWSDGEVAALKRAVRAAIGRAKLPKRLNMKLLSSLSKQFGRTINAISARWQYIAFAERIR